MKERKPAGVIHACFGRCADCKHLQWKVDRWRGGYCPKLKKKVPGTRRACHDYKDWDS